MGLKTNKRGITTLALIAVIFISFFLMIGLVVLSYTMGIVDSSLSLLSGTIGNMSIQDNYQATLQPGIISMEITVPQIMSIGVLLGMVIVMLLVGWQTKKTNRLWILLDVVILVVCEMLAFFITESFTNFIISNPAFVAIARDTLPLGAKFILNLTIIIPSVGVLIMLATYLITKDKTQEEFVN